MVSRKRDNGKSKGFIQEEDEIVRGIDVIDMKGSNHKLTSC